RRMGRLGRGLRALHHGLPLDGLSLPGGRRAVRLADAAAGADLPGVPGPLLGSCVVGRAAVLAGWADRWRVSGRGDAERRRDRALVPVHGLSMGAAGLCLAGPA